MINPADRLREDEVAVFLFHGVIEQHHHRVRNYTRKHIDREHFVGILESLKAAGQAVSMDDVLSSCDGGGPLPPHAFAITFDDGFENNLTVAAPILMNLEIPATFYVTTSFIDQNAMSWIDRIEWCFDRIERATLNLQWRSSPLEISDTETKIAALSEIRAQIKSKPHIDTALFVSSIFDQCGLAEVRSSHQDIDQKMNWFQLRQLAKLPEMTIGGHSHSHAILSFLDAAALAREIDTSLDLLKERANIGPRHYSYPEGLSHCYSPAVIDALQARGVRCCPTAEDSTNPAMTSPFLLKRIMVT
jgi:peptidoglycan/xylan/chitin deacetylase (PgdA/CDA1 family)